MDRIGARLLIGIVLVCLGVSIAIELIFGIAFPIVRAAFAVLLIVLGVRLVQQARARRGEHAPAGEAWLADCQFVPEGALDHDARYDISFGRGVVDLTRIGDPAVDVTISVHTLFGTSVVRIDPKVPYDVEGHAALGEVRMPDRSATALGNVSYRGPASHPPRLHLKVDAVFGACRVVEAQPATTALQVS